MLGYLIGAVVIGQNWFTAAGCYKLLLIIADNSCY